ncbi:MAG: DUF488 family protein [Planctomycetaceae bacterium]
MSKLEKHIQITRAYDVDESTKGYRVLVDRLWPRGIKKESLRLDHWAKELAPSTKLRKWFDHDPERWDDFQRRYEEELAERNTEMRQLMEEVGDSQTILLIYAAKDQYHNHATVLRRVLETVFS